MVVTDENRVDREVVGTEERYSVVTESSANDTMLDHKLLKYLAPDCIGCCHLRSRTTPRMSAKTLATELVKIFNCDKASESSWSDISCFKYESARIVNPDAPEKSSDLEDYGTW